MIDFQNVFKSFGARDLFNDASFRVEKGERVGIVGPNGAGKSTLFALICGEMSADKGEVVIPQKAKIGLLHQQLDFFKAEQPLIDYVSAASGELDRISVRMLQLETMLTDGNSSPAVLNELGELQTRFEHMGGYEIRHKAAAALAGLGFEESALTKAIGSFSGGWQMRACMARVILSDPDILLLDEPSNYLDIPAVEWLQRKLKSFEGTLLLISHDRFLLNSLTNVTIEVDNAKTTRYAGNYAYYVREREERRKHAVAAAENLERKKEQLERNIDRFRYKASKASQVQSWIKMLDKMDDVDIPDELHFRGTIRIPEPPHSGRETVAAENISHSYDGVRTILSDVNFRIERGEKVGIIGYNGAGKTTLLRILAERFQPSGGNIRLGHKVIIGYQAQEFAELLPPEMSVYDIVKQAAAEGMPEKQVRAVIGAFGFSGDDSSKQCKVLSGGEKIRLCFARIFVNPPNFLILDEPTTHLDIAAREALQQSLKSYGGTVCMVSHDVEFLRGTADVILEVRGHHVTRYGGDYDYYRERIAARETEISLPGRTEPKSADNQKERRKERALRRQELSKEKKRLESAIARIEKHLDEAEQEKAKIEEELATPGVVTDFSAKQRRLSELYVDIASDTEEWDKESTALAALLEEYEAIE